MLYPSEMGALTPLYANTAVETAYEGAEYYVPWARKGAPLPIVFDHGVQYTSASFL